MIRLDVTTKSIWPLPKTSPDHALEGKKAERDRILTLYRRNIIGLADLERQMDTIAAEESLVQQRVASLMELQSNQEARQQHLETAEELLERLRQKLASPLPFEVKRQIAEALVASITIDTRQTDTAKEAQVTVTYCFDPPDGGGALNRTDMGSLPRSA